MEQLTPSYLDSFNPAQRQAVEYCEGPALVIAGAGSGKTRVLTYKIAYLMQHGYQPWSILALTFTNKAAGEMKSRIAQIVGDDYAKRLWMGTFHSIFLRILRAEHEHIGFSPQFTIYDAADSKSLIKSIIKELGLDDKVYRPGDVLGAISNAKNQLVTARQYVDNPANMQSDARQDMPAIGAIFLRYASRCRQSDAMDFDDILLFTYLLFEEHPEVLERWEQRFRYVLVDEYQDTNFAQHRIVWQLTSRHQKVCVVGDDAQSIYSFRGANIDNILTFCKIYDNAQLFKLEQNYRSTQNIVQAANSLISKNRMQIHKDVFSQNEKGEKLHVIDTQSDMEEAKKVTALIRDIRRAASCQYSDFAILYRTNAQSRTFEEELRRASIPYRIYGGLSFYQRKEIKDIIAYLRLAINPNDEEAFKRVVNYPARGIGQTTLTKVVEAAVLHETSLWNVISDPSAYGASISGAAQKRLADFRNMIERFGEMAAKMPVDEAGPQIVRESGIMADIYQDATPENLSRQENVEELISGMYDFVGIRREEGSEQVYLTDYLSEVALLTDKDSDNGEEEHKVTLMTIHAAKGLEFQHVFVVGLEEGLFPSQMVSGSPRAMEEERRLFYVAITRAKTSCYLTHAACRYRYGKMEFSSPSRFLTDINPIYLDRKQTAYSSRKSVDSEVELPWLRRKMNSGMFDRPLRPTAGNHDGRTVGAASSSAPSVAHPQSSAHQQQSSAAHPQSSAPLRSSTASQQSSASSASAPLSVGTRILHNRFGRGTVTKMEGSGEGLKATIEFEVVGSKQLLLKFAKYTVID